LQLLLSTNIKPQEGLYARLLEALGIQASLPEPFVEELGKALHAASCAGQLGAMRFLLHQRADIEARDGSQATPLMEAASAGTAKAVKLLLRHGANIDKRKGGNGYTALHCACATGCADAARLLVDSGANTEIRGSPICSSDELGVTPLMIGVSEGHLEVIQLLLKGRADMNARDGKKRSPLELAVVRERASAFQLLLDNGAPVTERCLQVASESRCKRIRILLEGACG
jgi:ankyrin repeat protein